MSEYCGWADYDRQVVVIKISKNSAEDDRVMDLSLLHVKDKRLEPFPGANIHCRCKDEK